MSIISSTIGLFVAGAVLAIVAMTLAHCAADMSLRLLNPAEWHPFARYAAVWTLFLAAGMGAFVGARLALKEKEGR